MGDAPTLSRGILVLHVFHLGVVVRSPNVSFAISAPALQERAESSTLKKTSPRQMKGTEKTGRSVISRSEAAIVSWVFRRVYGGGDESATFHGLPDGWTQICCHARLENVAGRTRSHRILYKVGIFVDG